MINVAVIEIGGTHATAAMVDTATWSIRTPMRRTDLDAHASAEDLLTAMSGTADGLDAPQWGIAIPDPFDYETGIGRFHDVGKFESLDGVDVRAELAAHLGVSPSTLTFSNDADAFTLGEWVVGAGKASHRCVGLTLGTGVGSGWIAEGRVVDPEIPLGGRIHQLQVDGLPLEDVMSRRAIRLAYSEATGDAEADVREIAALARVGDEPASAVLETALTWLGRAAAPVIDAFGADVVVIGGSMAKSWDLFEPWFRAGWGRIPVPELRTAMAGDGAGLIGAAYAATISDRS